MEIKTLHVFVQGERKNNSKLLLRECNYLAWLKIKTGVNFNAHYYLPVYKRLIHY